MCKGSGMISPDMATMLAVLTTDVPVAPEAAYGLLKQAVDVSFNRVTVDSDTSTNDSVFFLASGAAGGPVAGTRDEKGNPVPGVDELESALAGALRLVCENLARQIAADGEGATKLVTVKVRGARSTRQAELVARAVANSPLVKTAIAGRDCNWGRIAAAAGRSGANFSQDSCDISIMGLLVCKGGQAQPFSEEEAARLFEQDEIVIELNLHEGGGVARMWTCDLTHGYIHINADYRS